MKHTPTAIQVIDLYGRIMADCDDFDIFDALQIGPEKPKHGGTAWEQYDDELRDWVAENRDAWVVVSWPEHVINPRFNGDANYNLCGSREDAAESEPLAANYRD